MTTPRFRGERLRERLAPMWAHSWRWVLAALGAMVATWFLLRSGSASLTIALVIAVLVVGAALTASKPMAIALMAMPALFIVERIGLGGTDLTISDAALAAAFGTAVLLAQRPFSPELRWLLWLNAIYQFATLITVIINPYSQNVIEWFHAWLLISGALVVGWGVGRAGYARLAFRLMIAAATIIALSSLFTALLNYTQEDFGPAAPEWPYPMNKNFAGDVMAFVALIVYVNPAWAALKTNTARMLLVILGCGILVTQSRQALIGLLVAVVFVVSRRKLFGHSRLALLLLIPAAWLIYLTIHDQIESQNRFNSLFQRLDWFREVYAYWKHAPIFGHGLRFWYVDDTVPYQPPQAELEVAASAGLVGLAAFAIMWIGVLVVLWRMDPAYGTLAAVVVLSRLVQAQFDLFWVTAQVSIPFVIAGICLGAKALAEADPAPAESRAGESQPRRKRPTSIS